MDPKIVALLILASFPFIGAVVLGWVHPNRTWAARYRRARARTDAMARRADEAHARVAAAGARVLESERRLSDEELGPGG